MYQCGFNIDMEKVLEVDRASRRALQRATTQEYYSFSQFFLIKILLRRIFAYFCINIREKVCILIIQENSKIVSQEQRYRKRRKQKTGDYLFYLPRQWQGKVFTLLYICTSTCMYIYIIQLLENPSKSLWGIQSCIFEDLYYIPSFWQKVVFFAFLQN